MSIRIRRGTNAERLTVVLEEGEFGYTTDTKKVYIGDGVTLGGNVVTGGGIGSIPDLDQVTTQGNTTLNTITVGGFTTGYALLDVAATPTLQPGMFAWNDTDGTADLRLKGNNVTLQIGEEIVAHVVNKTGANLLESEYKVVRVRIASEGGSSGQKLAVVLAQGNNDPDSATTLGIVTEDIANNQEGFITILGNVNKINTTGSLQGETWLDGDVLYLSPTTPGALTKVKPVAPQHTVTIGYVLYSHPVNGKIFVKVDNGYELDELHNVLITSVANNDLLQYDSTQQVWKNVAPSIAVPTPTLAQVTTAGNTTTNAITVGGLTVNSVNATINTISVGLGAGTGSETTAVGKLALSSNIAASYNTAFGFETLKLNTTGVDNTAVGSSALNKNVTGVRNTSVGSWALNAITGSDDNTAVGAEALILSTGYFNTAVGSRSLWKATTGFNNTAVGGEAMLKLTTGSDNTAVGVQTLNENTAGGGNTAVGSGALFNTNRTGPFEGSGNTAVGNFAGRQNNIGSYNSFLGLEAGYNNTSGYNNVFIGNSAGYNNTTGFNNIFIGANSTGASITEGNRTWIGNNSTTSTWLGGNLLVGTTTNGSYKADINGNVRFQGSVTATLANTTTSNVVYYDSSTGLMTYGTIAAGTGTVTSVDMTVPTGLSISGNPITTSGTLALTFTAGYSIPTTTSQTNWDTAYTNRITSLTTTGSSGASTLISNTLNIPNYTLAGLGGQPLATNLTSLSGLSYVSTSFVKMTAAGTFALDTNTYYLASNPNGYTSNTGTVTSVDITLPTGLSVTGNPITTSGTLAVTFTAGYSIPTTTSQTDWDTAYTNRITSLTTTGSSGAATLISNTLNIPNYTLSGLGGVPTTRTLTINGTSYDLSADRSWTVTAATPTLDAVTTAGNTTTNSITVGGLTVNADATINTVTVGRGNGSLSQNVTVGGATLTAVTTGDENTVLGYAAANQLTTGAINVFIGKYSGGLMTSATGNVAVGANTLGATSAGGSPQPYSGSYNTAIGNASMRFIESGLYNTGLGSAALYSIRIGIGNTAVGYSSLSSVGITTGDYNTAVGFEALTDNTASNNVAVGYRAGYSNTTGTGITAIGFEALFLSTGIQSTAVGYQAGKSIVTNSITAIGHTSFTLATGAQNTGVGRYSGSSTTTGYANTAIGENALGLNTTGHNNVAIGYNSVGYFGAGTHNKSENVGVGNFALGELISGTKNVAVGMQALWTNAAGLSNTAIGWRALASTQGNNNTAIGQQAGYAFDPPSSVNNITGSNNIFIGYQSTGVSGSESNRTWIGNSSTTSTWLAGNLLVGTTTDGGYKAEIAGTMKVSGVVTLSGITSASAANVLYYDSVTGIVTYSTAPTGGGSYTVTNVSSSYVNATTSGTEIVLVDTTSGTVTITLPSAVGNTATLVIKKVAGNSSVVLDGASAETIDGGATATIVKQYESVTLVSNNSNWLII